ncbi:MAG: hypothetical protein H6738_14660 [Alphaproteobacteria bacterium]|nr:hypothetical protein [Alphaproteobacteria bacterium]MCB9698017.1 hypothetical protein [Alphaproteobacteria bacterium]
MNEHIIQVHSTFADRRPVIALARLLDAHLPDIDEADAACLFLALQVYGFSLPGADFNNPSLPGSDLGRWDAAVIVAALSKAVPDPNDWDGGSRETRFTAGDLSDRAEALMSRLLVVPALTISGYSRRR